MATVPVATTAAAGAGPCQYVATKYSSNSTCSIEPTLDACDPSETTLTHSHSNTSWRQSVTMVCVMMEEWVTHRHCPRKVSQIVCQIMATIKSNNERRGSSGMEATQQQ